MNHKDTHNKIKIISGVIGILVIISTTREYVRSQLNMASINFSSQQQILPSSSDNPFNRSFGQDMERSRNLELNRQQWASNINSQIAANEEQYIRLRNFDVMFLTLAIVSSSGWIFYCTKSLQKSNENK